MGRSGGSERKPGGAIGNVGVNFSTSQPGFRSILCTQYWAIRWSNLVIKKASAGVYLSVSTRGFTVVLYLEPMDDQLGGRPEHDEGQHCQRER